jgi:hypothetical protein
MAPIDSQPIFGKQAILAEGLQREGFGFAVGKGWSAMDSRGRNRRYFRIAGITVGLTSDLDFEGVTFQEALRPFAVPGPGDDNVTLRHRFGLPDLKGMDLGEVVYRKPPWQISRRGERWYYLGIKSEASDADLQRVALFKADYSTGTIYSPESFAVMARDKRQGWPSLSLLPTDQIWLAPLLADRRAVLLHSAGVILDGAGLLFVGHSTAGKSTLMTMLRGRGEILCDDRNILRRWPDRWRVHGTWSHGDVSEVSAADAPLGAILFLRKDTRNTIAPLTDRREIWKGLLATLVKPLATAAWWNRQLDTLEQLVSEVPCYTVFFDRSGGVVPELESLAAECWPGRGR